ncbi:MAG: site-specific DNA-methyltransferase [Alphaproteobacteria bacterium]|nr:site-specific DNA-methyltransferase [Alphaproteobacteria bacterium]
MDGVSLQDAVRAWLAPPLDHPIGRARTRWFDAVLAPALGTWSPDAATWLAVLADLCGADGSLRPPSTQPPGAGAVAVWAGAVTLPWTPRVTRGGLTFRGRADRTAADVVGIDADGTIVLDLGPGQADLSAAARRLREGGVAATTGGLRMAARALACPTTTDGFLWDDDAASLRDHVVATVVARVGAAGWDAQALACLGRMGPAADAFAIALARRERALLDAWRAPRPVVAEGCVVRLGDLPADVSEAVRADPGWPAVCAEAEILGIDPQTDVARVPVDTAHVPSTAAAVQAAIATPQGWLVWGDNAAGMRHVAASGLHAQCAYVDPPFNTGRTFDYRDRYDHHAWEAMLGERLAACRDLLRPTGVLWLHLDTHAAHLGRALLDRVFGEGAFLNEVVWQFGGKGLANVRRRLVPLHNTLHLVARDPSQVTLDNRERGRITASVRARFGHVLDDAGKVTFGALTRAREAREHRVLAARFERRHGRAPEADDVAVDYAGQGALVRTVWLGQDVPIVRTADPEHTGFVTQKPERLLQRVVAIGSAPGDVVLDPFAGSGTTLAVAHKLGRRWVGMEAGAHAATTFDDGDGVRVGVLGRLKQVVAGAGTGEPAGISAAVGWQGGGSLRWTRLGPADAAIDAVRW